MLKWLAATFFAAIVGAVVYFSIVPGKVVIPAPSEDKLSHFVVPKPSLASQIAVPIEADLSKFFAQATSEIRNPISQDSTVLDIPTQLHMQYYATELVLKGFEIVEDYTVDVYGTVCVESRTVCSKWDTLIKEICPDAPVIKQVCELVEESVCVVSEAICISHDVVVVGKEVLQRTVTKFREVEEQVLKVVDKLADLDAEVDHTVNFLGGDLVVTGDQLSGYADVEIKVKVNARLEALSDSVKLAEVNGITSCGYYEPMRKIRLHINSRLETLPNLSVSIRDPSLEIQWLDDCELTAFDIDVEDLINLPGIKSIVQKAVDKAVGKAVDKLNSNLSFSDALAGVWPEVTDPIEIDGFGFLSLNPERISTSSIVGDGKLLSMTAALVARPVVSDTMQDYEQIEVPVVSLDAIDPRLEVSVAIGVSFEQIVEELKFRLTEEIPDAIEIKELKLFASESKLVIGVGLRKPIRGTIYFVGEGKLEAKEAILSFPDLDFTVDTKNAIINTVDFALHDTLKFALRKWARFHFKKQMEDILFDNSYQLIDLEGSGNQIEIYLEDGYLTQFAVLPAGIQVVANLQGFAQVNLAP